MERLVALAHRSLESLDVPVAAVVVYDNEIIGEGFNTVLRNTHAGEHAEINAISDALRKCGNERFAQFDRSRLVLISTFEPCLMCLGACLNNAIRTVYYLQPKEWREILQERKGLILHYVRRKQVTNSGQQIDLFRLHPDFPSQKRYQGK
jgi:tRNA(adenine34) deaminase